MAGAGSFVVRASGARGVLASGAASVFDGSGACDECCGIPCGACSGTQPSAIIDGGASVPDEGSFWCFELPGSTPGGPQAAAYTGTIGTPGEFYCRTWYWEWIEDRTAILSTYRRWTVTVYESLSDFVVMLEGADVEWNGSEWELKDPSYPSVWQGATSKSAVPPDIACVDGILVGVAGLDYVSGPPGETLNCENATITLGSEE